MQVSEAALEYVDKKKSQVYEAWLTNMTDARETWESEILVHAGRAKEASEGICRFCLYYDGRTIILIPSSAKDARVCSSGIFSPSFGKIEMVENGQHWP